MRIAHISTVTGLIAGLLLCLMTSPAAFAAFGGPVSPTIRGTVQNIDYLHHAITVNGQTYAVAGNAKFTSIGGFAVLHVGMPIAYTLSSPANNSMPGSTPAAQPSNAPPVIDSITWLPGG